MGGKSESEQPKSLLLAVRDLRVGLQQGERKVFPVDGVSFDLYEGETVAIVGESGSGKSMTALALMGLQPKRVATVSGSAVLCGRELVGMESRETRKLRGVSLAYMPQDPVSALNPSLTVGYQIMETLLVHGLAAKEEAQSRTVELLTSMGIPNLPSSLKAYPHQFSGGMRQRIVLAMALIGQPRVLLADEPTTAVDVTTQEQIVDLLWSIQHKTALGIVFITHDLGVVARVATRVAVMYAGRVVEYGDADQIFEHPSHPYTRGLLRSVAFDRLGAGTRLEALDGAQPELGSLPEGCAFHPRCRFAQKICTEITPALASVPGQSGESACHMAAQGLLPAAEEGD